MPGVTGERSAHFPAIEKKYGQPMTYWFGLLKKLGRATYAEQIALLREGSGFSQAHANAVVMHHRGSTTSKRHSSYDAFLATLGNEHRALIEEIFTSITKKFPNLKLVIAWNQPMLKSGNDYVIGISPAKNHLTVGPWGDKVIERFTDDLAGFETNKKTFKVPLDWQVDPKLLQRIVQYRLDQLS